MKPFEVYPLYPIEPVRGRGCYVIDEQGNAYLDLYGGNGAVSIGHCIPYYIEAIQHQVAQFGFYSNILENSLQTRFAQKLGQMSGYPTYSLFLCNSGSEANENALKLASHHTGNAKVLAFKGSFHGHTSGSVAVTDNPYIISPFSRTDHVHFVRMGDIEAVEKELAKGEYAAVIIEGIQGLSGVRMPGDDFMRQLRKVTKAHEVMLIVDEIQSGYGRTGKFFAHQFSGIRPDLITVGKGMGNGFPIGGVLISPDFTPVRGMLASTTGGNQLACAAAMAVLDVIERDKLIENADKVGTQAIEILSQMTGIIADVRGRGLMIGIDVNVSVPELRRKLLLDYCILTGGSGSSTIRILPPLCVTSQQMERFIRLLAAAIGS
ncbi:MAG: aspartate aminotransferase family protein [Bacteroidales bacterium]|nr:aspartate aminotransferase family protein [Bacteroidales bacterium]